MDLKLDVEPIGIVRSCFPCKNGTPRQSTIAPKARGQVKISKGIYNNPEHALDGLQEFSHVWIIFVFHKNKPGRFVKAKVSPPRLNGGRIGVFATRSPYRLNPIGLSLVKLESVEGDTLHFSGHDLVDGTPVLDIKPYIREYDAPPDNARTPTNATPSRDGYSQPGGEVKVPPSDARESPLNSCHPAEGQQTPGTGGPLSQHCAAEREPSRPVADRHWVDGDPPAMSRPKEDRCLTHSGARPGLDQAAMSSTRTSDHKPAAGPADRTAVDVCVSPPEVAFQATGDGDGDTWLSRLRPETWTVDFTPSAESQLLRFSAAADAGAHRLHWLRDAAELRSALVEVLTAEPRSVYRRAQGDQLLYHFALDACHVTCWFDSGRKVIEVLRLQTLVESPIGDVAAKSVKEGDVISPPLVEGSAGGPT